MILRPATFDDEKLLFDWRNDPSVLETSSSGMPCSIEGHHAWMNRVMLDNETFLYIAEVDGLPVGQGRIERAWKAISPKMDSCFIGYSIGKEYRRRGYGTALVRELVRIAKTERGYHTVGARIKRSNMASVIVAIVAGVNSIELF